MNGGGAHWWAELFMMKVDYRRRHKMPLPSGTLCSRRLKPHCALSRSPLRPCLRSKQPIVLGAHYLRWFADFESSSGWVSVPVLMNKRSTQRRDAKRFRPLQPARSS